MKGFCPLASGSKGNCIYVGTDQAKILIDAGLSAKSINEKLNQIGVSLDQIDAILITHEHTDHIKGLDQLAFRHRIPIFSNTETAKGICEVFGDCPSFKLFTTGETFEYKDMEIHPFSIQHDTLDPVAFTIKVGQLKLGFCTDLGFVTTLVKNSLKNCDYLYLEANHQVSMVHASSRPLIYKQRVLSRQGHLSNDECADLLAEIYHDNLKHVHLAHLSSECNAPDLALEIIHSKLQHKLNLSIAYQDKVSRAILF